MDITFSFSSGINDTVFGKCQAPIKFFVEKHGEEFEKNSILKELFYMYTSENFGDTFSGMTGMSGPKPVGENGSYPTDGMQVGYEKLMQFVTWKNSFSISAEAMEDGKVMDLSNQPLGFITSWHRNREKFGAALYANAMMGKSTMKYKGQTFDISGADGVSLFHKAHKPKVSGDTQCNMFSNEFSAENLDRAESAMQLFRGENDEILDVAPTTILIPNNPELKREVFAAIGADKDPNTANNGFNYQFGRWNVTIWNYLNQFLDKGLKPWVLLDQAYNKAYAGVVFGDRKKLEVKSSIDEDTDANVWRGRGRFNATGNDWRFACVGGIADGLDLTELKL